MGLSDFDVSAVVDRERVPFCVHKQHVWISCACRLIAAGISFARALIVVPGNNNVVLDQALRFCYHYDQVVFGFHLVSWM